MYYLYKKKDNNKKKWLHSLKRSFRFLYSLLA